MKKSERHRVKRDELFTVFERVTLYVEENLRQVGLVAALGLVALLGTLGVMTWMENRAENASFLLGQLIQTYRAPLALSQEAQQAPAGVITYATAEERAEKVIEQANDILARFGSSRMTPKALYYKALALAGEKKYDDTAKVLDELLARYPRGLLAPMARYELARVREEQGNPREALIHFQALADDAATFFPKEESLMGVARCQEELGNRDEALKIYRKILSDFPNSDYQGEIKSKVDQLS